ncbi:hypothetical protein ABZ502_17355 [Streptomyces abikoensis]|uniref:hypothetical protein n=1 Tax=Streptomyces abikoensis TaxID=97398 RepID=UPI0033E4CFCD
MDKFFEALGGKLAERWLTISVPATVFWLGGLLAWSADNGGVGALRRPFTWLGGLPAGTQIVAVAVALLAVAASGWLVSQIADPVLRLAQGYGRWWPGRDKRSEKFKNQFTVVINAFPPLAAKVLAVPSTATPKERQKYIELTRKMRRLPGPGRFMPTRLGNTLRAAESQPVDRYGLDVVTIWPHLWLLLPDFARTELTTARAKLHSGVTACLWGVLFIGFAPWTCWAVLVGLATVAGAWWLWLPGRAEAYADLVQATVDVHRRTLYDQLRWPLPLNPADEPPQGRLLSTYLARGLSRDQPQFRV